MPLLFSSHFFQYLIYCKYWERWDIMSFISKILDAFKMESTREMGNKKER